MDPSHRNPNVSSEAQHEFDSLFTPPKAANHHPEDSDADDDDKLFQELDEEAEHIQKQISDTMRMPTLDGTAEFAYRLPDESFDRGRRTGVKGIVADARQEMRKLREQSGEKVGSRERNDERAILALRESRINDIKKRRDAENDLRNRRQYEEYGTFDCVDATGLDNALQSAPRDTVVVIFIYDSPSELSNWFLEAIEPLVSEHPRVHFLKIHCERLDFEAAGTPAIVAYCKEKGEGPFANLTPLEEFMPNDAVLDPDVLKDILRRYQVL